MNKIYKSKNLIFLQPVFDDKKVWGGERLKEYGYHGSSKRIGEAYLISSLNSFSSKILNLNINEDNLFDFYNSNRDWFNNYKGEYPILSKLIDAKQDLSIQVHPDNDYALKKFNKLGKYECWYIIHTKDNSIFYGLKKYSLEGLKFMNINTYLDYVNELKINNNDVIEIFPGTVHAIKKNTFLLEIQQSSDLTFRIYDYDRIENNKKRQLHLEEAQNVIKKVDFNVHKVIDHLMVDNVYFKTYIYDLNKLEFTFDPNQVNDNYNWIELIIIDSKEAFIIENNQLYELKKGISILIKKNILFTIKGTINFSLTFVK